MFKKKPLTVFVFSLTVLLIYVFCYFLLRSLRQDCWVNGINGFVMRFPDRLGFLNYIFCPFVFIDTHEPLNLGMGTLLVVAVSLIFVIPSSFIKNNIFKWLIIFVVPYFVAYVWYWSPVWFFNELSGEYHSWELLVIMPVFIVSVFILACVCLIIGRLRTI